MRTLRVGAVALNQVPLDWDQNQRRIVEVLRAARAQDVGLLCLPELCIPGYGCEDAFHGHDVLRQSERVLLELLPETRGLVACIGLPRLFHRALYNTAAVVADGQLLGFVAKQHLAGDGIHYEPRWFKPWDGHAIADSWVGGKGYPFGDLLFEVGGVRFGFEICEDAWVAGRPGARLAAHGADVILNPSASHFAFGKLSVRHRFVTEGARAFGTAYVYANLLGNEAGRAIYDGGALIASRGAVVAQGPRLTFREWDLTTAVVDIAAARLLQARTASFQPAAAEHPGLVRAAHRWPAAGEPTPPCALDGWERSATLKEEEFSRSVALALFDYLRKSRSKGFVVSLSGGADSSAVACLVALMVRGGVAELGLDGFRTRLRHIPALARCGDVAACTRALLTTVYQATAQSSERTRQAARGLAEALGCRHLELDVEPMVQDYLRVVGQALGRTPNWQDDDLVLQNIQARVRGPSAWMIANLEDALLLATSNRSEAAVGYATMDGDTCGGLSPLGGVDKAFIRHWLAWLEREGPLGLGTVPSLHLITSQRSTPELRPPAAGQTSEADLMPFPLLDRIERLAIHDKLPPVEILPRLVAEFAGYPPAQLRAWVEQFFRLWCRNQWKRERLAPAFHVDDENLDPRTWCRFPILSGGFARELSELPPPR